MSPKDGDSESKRKQEARAKLREDFLRAVMELQDQPVEILTYEVTTLKGTFCGWNPNGKEIMVKDMTTPASDVMPSALLRSSDILVIQFKSPVQLP